MVTWPGDYSGRFAGPRDGVCNANKKVVETFHAKCLTRKNANQRTLALLPEAFFGTVAVMTFATKRCNTLS